MRVLVMHLHSMTQYEYMCSNISYADDVYTLTVNGNTYNYNKNDYKVAII